MATNLDDAKILSPLLRSAIVVTLVVSGFAAASAETITDLRPSVHALPQEDESGRLL